MSTSQAANSGASLASATPSTLANREPSREELESARVLNLLNGSGGPGGFLGIPASQSAQQQAGLSADETPGTPSPGGGRRPSEVSEYHSLDDTLGHRNATQSPRSTSRDAPGSTPRSSTTGGGPVSGQVCR